MYEFSFRVVGYNYDQTVTVTADSVSDADRQVRDLFSPQSYAVNLLGSRDLSPQTPLAW